MRKLLAFLVELTICVFLVSGANRAQNAKTEEDTLQEIAEEYPTKGYFYVDGIGVSIGGPGSFELHILEAALGYKSVLLGVKIWELRYLPGTGEDITGSLPFYLYYVPTYLYRERIDEPYLIGYFYAGGSTWCHHTETIETEWEEKYKARYFEIGAALATSAVFRAKGEKVKLILEACIGYFAGSIDSGIYYGGASSNTIYLGIGVSWGTWGVVEYPW